MSQIILQLNPISGCHPVSEKSWGKRKKSSENFAMRLARTGRSHWILLVDKWLMKETTSKSTITSKMMSHTTWIRAATRIDVWRIVRLNIISFWYIYNIWQVGWDPQGHEQWFYVKITSLFWKKRWKTKPERVGQPKHNAVCTRGR